MTKEKEIINSLLKSAGITINGNNDCDPQVHNNGIYGRVMREGPLGLGESYMDGWWDCKKLDHFFYRVLVADLDEKIKGDWIALLRFARNYILNPGRKSKAFEIGKTHYNIGNDLFCAMLDKRMTYTCAYWENANNLDEAQEAKLDLICRKIGLKNGDKVLDIGSGWGSFINFAAEKYGAECVGITVSQEQADYANSHRNGLPVKTILQDYRDIKEKFDHIVSIGMFEHVGYKNYRTFMKIVNNALKDDGLFFLHAIGGNKSVLELNPWITKYIFPNSIIPSMQQISKATEGLFVMEDWHNLGANYDKTLMAWHKNFENNWSKIKHNYDERFYRMWRYYLLSCAGLFRARKNQLWHIVLSKKGVLGGYKSIR